ncbi:MAG: immunity protein Imm33 domain-containing protein [Bacillota bacterium]
MSNNEVKVFSRKINNKNVSLQCIENLSGQAEFLLELIEQEQEHTNVLKDNFKIQVGWSIYTVKEQNGGFILLSPDYEKNPFQDTTKDLSLSIFVQVQQNIILKKANVDGEPVSFQDTIVVLKDALNSDSVYMERKEKCKKGDSGWYLGLIEDDVIPRTVEDYKAIYTFQLLQLKPHLLQLLSLPTGCLAIINGTKIEEVIDSNDNRLI